MNRNRLYWRINPEKTDEYVIDLHGLDGHGKGSDDVDYIEDEVGVDAKHGWYAQVKWDGCVHLYLPEKTITGYWHDCDGLRYVIDRFVELHEIGREHFGPEWEGTINAWTPRRV